MLNKNMLKIVLVICRFPWVLTIKIRANPFVKLQLIVLWLLVPPLDVFWNSLGCVCTRNIQRFSYFSFVFLNLLRSTLYWNTKKKGLELVMSLCNLADWFHTLRKNMNYRQITYGLLSGRLKMKKKNSLLLMNTKVGVQKLGISWRKFWRTLYFGTGL